LSGSASSEDEDSDGDAVNALVDKTKKLLKTIDEDEDDSRPSAPVTAHTWFHSPPSTQIGVYRALFTVDSNNPQGYLDELKDMQRSQERKWALFMVAGGHFAGAIVRVSRSEEEEEGGGTKTKKKQPKQDTEVLRHKTFHRYTSEFFLSLVKLGLLTVD